MGPDNATTSTRRIPARPEATFSVAEANRALVLVRRVVTDVVERYGQLLELRSKRQEAAHEIAPPGRMQELQDQIDATMDRLHQLYDELAGIGCVLKDWSSGLVDFPARNCGRKVWLCWRLGEPGVTHWHELNDGFAGRKVVGPDFA